MSEDENKPAATKRRHHIEERPEEFVPIWRRVWFMLFVTVLLLLLVPLLPAAWHIFGPDEKAPAKKEFFSILGDAGDGGRMFSMPISPASAESEVARARAEAGALLSVEKSFPEDIRRGDRYDATLTPAFLIAAKECTKSTPAFIAHPYVPADITAADGVLRAALADARARRDVPELVARHAARLLLARSLVYTVSTPADFLSALRHEREVLSEIRFDTELLVTNKRALSNLLPALVAHTAAPDIAFTKRLALNFDARLDVQPDAGLLAMRDKSPASAGTTFFEKIARFSRRPNRYRHEVSAMLANFGDVMARPTFVESGRLFLRPATASEVSLASLLLRDRVFEKLGGDTATHYFFPKQPAEPGDLEFALKFEAFAKSPDILGVAYLMHRRAELTTAIAYFDRTRFDAAATAYYLAIRYRRALAGGKWPKEIAGIFDGLLTRYPFDPFTDEPVAYSRKNLTLHSRGADGVDQNGLTDAEFASELAELWEPTIPLESGGELNPAAFGIRPEKKR